MTKSGFNRQPATQFGFVTWTQADGFVKFAVAEMRRTHDFLKK